MLSELQLIADRPVFWSADTQTPFWCFSPQHVAVLMLFMLLLGSSSMVLTGVSSRLEGVVRCGRGAGLAHTRHIALYGVATWSGYCCCLHFGPICVVALLRRERDPALWRS